MQKPRLIQLCAAFPLLLAGWLALPFQSTSQDAEAEASAHLPKDPLAWLVGDWRGEGFGGRVQEVWLGRQGGAMLGVFRHVTKDKPKFYELMTINGPPESQSMSLKHFQPDLVGWEEKDKSLNWAASDLRTRSVRFGPVLYELDAKQVLHVWVELGEGKTEHLELTRK